MTWERHTVTHLLKYVLEPGVLISRLFCMQSSARRDATDRSISCPPCILAPYCHKRKDSTRHRNTNMIDEITSQSLARNTSKGSCNKKSQLTDLYEDKSIASEKTTKPLTNVTNSYVPQTDVHLYQFPASFYSCEVRLVLEEKGINYEEHDICIIGGVFDQYEPDYVRINP